jgi:hypothetical protein
VNYMAIFAALVFFVGFGPWLRWFLRRNDERQAEFDVLHRRWMLGDERAFDGTRWDDAAKEPTDD